MNLLFVGDGLRVVDDETKDLILDQTIEKVSFCAPDRNYEKGFSYICRDGKRAALLRSALVKASSRDDRVGSRRYLSLAHLY